MSPHPSPQKPSDPASARITLAYPAGSLLGDYLRAAAGAALGLVALLAIDTATPVTVICIGLVAIFGGFGLRTLIRHRSRVILDREAVTVTGLRRKRLPWRDLERLGLRYFGNRRQRTTGGGFLELTLAAGGRKVKLESSLGDFDGLAWLAARHARAKGLELDDPSQENLLALGIDPTRDEAPPPGDEAFADLAPAAETAGESL